MKITSWILFGLAVALVLGVGAMVLRQRTLSIAEQFAAVEKRAADGYQDREQLIASFSQVLDRAIDVGDVELGTRVQMKRGRLLMELGAYDRAREDLTAVAAARPGDVGVENDLAELEARSGDFPAAQARVARMIQRDPGNTSAYVRLGRLHRQAADRIIERTLELLSRSLVPENIARARGILEHSSALQPGDPRRVALSQELRDLLASRDETLIESANNSTDQASIELNNAREAFTRSLQRSVDPEALAGLISLYERAGKTSLGVDLGTTTVRLGSLRANPLFGRALLSGLVRLGRLRYAADLATTWVQSQTPIEPDFCAECCVILWNAKRWPALQQGSDMLRSIGNTSQIVAANLYLGFSFIEQGLPQEGRQYLHYFAATDTPDPFPKARAYAWQYIARTCRQLGEPIPERTALQGLVDLEPELDPGAWLRLAELMMAAPHGGYREPEMRFAYGMSLAPERTSELLPRWHEIGVLELRSVGLDLAAVRTDLAHNRIWTPSADASPYELYRLAEVHADYGDYLRASLHVRKLLEKVPNFVPALDLAIRIADLQGRTKERMSYVLARVQRAGRTPVIDKILRELPLADPAPEDLLALMRADPDRSGRLALAEGLALKGRAEEALGLIQSLPRETLGDEGQLLIGRLHLALREPVRALAVLAPLAPGLFEQPQGLELFVRAGLGAGDHERMLQLGRDLADVLALTPDPTRQALHDGFVLSRARALWVADQFLAAGEGEAAQALLDAMDASPRLRGGDVSLRLAGAAVLLGDVRAARLAIERAQAFDTRGAAEYLALLLAAFEGRVDDLRYQAGVASSAGYTAGPLLNAQFLLLADRIEDAAVTLDAGLARDFADDPWWNLTGYAGHTLRSRADAFQFSPFLGRSAATAAELLFNGADGKSDPRLALVWISAVRQQIAAPFVRAWLARESSGAPVPSLWTEWIRTTLDAQWGLDGPALTSARRIRSRAADFGPAWNLEEAILSATVRTQAELQAARARRVGALGALAGTRTQRLLDDAAERATAGLYAEALVAVEEAAALEPTSVEVAVAGARIQLQTGQPVPAITALRTLLNARSRSGLGLGPAGADFVATYLGAIEAARKLANGVVTWDRAATLIAELGKVLPHDPHVALAAAELDLQQDHRNPTLGVARAYSRLDNFRSAHKGQSIESLGRGSVRGWSRFYIKLDPTRARRFLQAELALAPTNLETWIELARALEAEGDIKGALLQHELTARLSPSGAVRREILRLRTQREVPAEEIDAALSDIVANEGLHAPDAELLILAARGMMNQGPRSLERVANLLARVPDVAQLPPELAAEHDLLLATGYIMRGRPTDLTAARPALDRLKARTELDPYVATFVDALRGLAGAP
ncbi:MAG: hypothetical protein JNL28_12805 [Planctomycetes bacterium]|nr:hypothetical protein [Planctomycetota bacterium]